MKAPKYSPARIPSLTLNLFVAAIGFTLAPLCGNLEAQDVQTPNAKKPNILAIMGDDIGWYNPSIYHRGDMGYWTPNIDRIGKEGAMLEAALTAYAGKGRRLSDEELNGLIDELELKPSVTNF
jgi:hypothetical protein